MVDDYALVVMRNKYAEDIEELLSCPVCFEQPIGDIPTCNNGHHICHKCSQNVRKCPQCQGTFSGARNYMAETLAAKFNEIKDSLLDPAHNSNKKVLDDRKTISTQTDPLIFHKMNTSMMKSVDKSIHNFNNKHDMNDKIKYPCIVSICNNNFSAEDIIDHIKKTHAENFIEVDADAEAYVFFQQSWSINRETKKIDYAINVKSKGLFYFNLVVNEADQVLGNVKILSEHNAALKIYYFIEIEEATEDDQASKAYDGTVQCLNGTNNNNDSEGNDKSCIQYKLTEKNSVLTCTLKLYHCMK